MANAARSMPGEAPELDHVAHFVPDQDACRRALERLGFAPTPFSLQYHRIDPAQALAPVGTGNHCVMLRQGYLEFLVPLADTGVAAQLRAAIERYVGVHSIVLGTLDAARDYRRLQQTGFLPAPPLALQRPIDIAAGEATARFTVVRVPPDAMAEGRIQYCQHHTRELLWQGRWLTHANGALGLTAAFVCVPDLDEAAARYAQFTGQAPAVFPGKRVFHLRRGRIELIEAAGFAEAFGLEPPALPSIAGCELVSEDLERTRNAMASAGLPARTLDDGRILVHGGAALGGVFVFANGALGSRPPSP